jgi:hypothetical protein
MEILVKKVKVIDSTHGGEIFLLSGLYVDELNETKPWHTYVDPANRNYQGWEAVIEHLARNPGDWMILGHCHFKKRAKGLLDADSQPTIVEIRQAQSGTSTQE